MYLLDILYFQGPCPQDWLWHEENCYQFSSGSFNWEKSQENCLSLDAHLLKINSTDELVSVMDVWDVSGWIIGS